MPTRLRHLTLAAFLGLTGLSWAGAEIVEQIVAQVNNEIITFTQFNREKEALYQALRAQNLKGEELEQRYQKISKSILAKLVEELLLMQKAKEYGFTEDLDLEANAYVEDMMKENSIPSLDILKQEMRKAGVEYNDYVENIKRQILVNRIKGAIFHRKIKIMTGDVEQYYQSHLAEFTLPEKVELEEIVLYTKDKDKAEVRRRIDSILAELQAGQNFSEMAKAMSEGPTAKEGGNIGEFPVPSLSKIMSGAIANLQPGQFSAVMEMDFGFEILRLAKRAPARQLPLEEIRKDVENRIFNQRLEPVMKEYLKELAAESYIQVMPEFQSEYQPDSRP